LIKAVLFDLDGTLINTNELIIKSFEYTLKKHLNTKITRNEILATFGAPLRDVLARYDAGGADLMLEIFREYSEEHHDLLASSIEGVEEGLSLLKKERVKIAVVTSKRISTALRGLNLFSLDKYFDIIVGPEDTKIHKPFGDPALRACALLEVEPFEALMVGDSLNDILCGKNAGCKTCLVSYTALDLKEVMRYKPDYVVDSLIDILKICMEN
jgi:pyrophosphatase PpaX